MSLAKTLGVLSFTPLTMLQACAQAVDFKVGHHFGEGQDLMSASAIFSSLSRSNLHAMAYCGEELFKMELGFLSVFEAFSLDRPV